MVIIKFLTNYDQIIYSLLIFGLAKKNSWPEIFIQSARLLLILPFIFYLNVSAYQIYIKIIIETINYLNNFKCVNM